MRIPIRRLAAILSVTLTLALVPLPTFAAPASPALAAVIAPAGVTTADLTCVTFVTASLGFAAGASGTIIKTTDGGETWVKLTSGTTIADFRGIAFWSADVGVAVTHDRAIYKTTNGGTSWAVVNADMTANVFGAPPIGVNGATSIPGTTDSAMLFGGTNPNDGIFLSEQAWLTAFNGGVHWGNTPRLEPQIHLTDDGLGNTWPVGEGEVLGMDFSDGLHGWAVGDDMFPLEDTSTVYASADGGYTWARQTFPVALRLTGVAFANNSVGVIVSNEGRIFRTGNGGTVWTEASTVPAPLTALTGVGMIDASNAWAVGAGGKLLRTTDGGSVWSAGTSPVGSDLAAITFVGSHGVAIGKGGAIVVTDDGVSWHLPGSGADITAPTMTTLTSSSHLVEATWYSVPNAGFTWTASDAVGVTGYSYVLDSSASTLPDTTSEGSATTTSVVAPEGVRYFHVRAVDAAGNWSTPLHIAIRTDRTKPTTTDNHVASYSNSANITLTPTDALSGIQKTEWSINGGALQTGMSVAVITAGDFTLTYASTDNAGNRETTKTATFSVVPSPVDTTPPTMTLLSSSSHSVEATWYSVPNASFTWAAVDASGVVGYSYVLDDASVTEPVRTTMGSATGTTVVAPEGLRYMHVIAVDPSGNWSTPLHIAIRTDRTKPTTTDNHVASYAGSASITLTPSDALSGIQKTEWSINGGALQTGMSVAVSTAGNYTLTYASTDKAGNRETTKTVTFTISTTPTDVPAIPVEGTSRYLTAIAASKLAFPVAGTTPAVVIATGTNWPDALGGAALAGEVGGPILLTDPKTLPSAVRAEITRLGATTAYVLGSEAAVSKAVADAVEGMSGVTVVRLAGSNRYSTARAIAERVVTLQGGGTNRTFFVATGTNFPDALAASPLAASKGWPLFLVGAAGLSSSDLAYMKANGNSALILGSTSAVAASVETQLNTTFGSTNVERLWGSDRYSTGLDIVRYATSPAGGLTWATPAVATGTNFPDALSGGVLQGLDGSILLLTNGTTLTPSVGDAITAHKAEITEVRYLGSTSVVSVAVRTAIQAIVN